MNWIDFLDFHNEITFWKPNLDEIEASKPKKHTIYCRLTDLKNLLLIIF